MAFGFAMVGDAPPSLHEQPLSRFLDFLCLSALPQHIAFKDCLRVEHGELVFYYFFFVDLIKDT